MARLTPPTASPDPHRAQGHGEVKAYSHRRPEESVLYGVVQAELATFLGAPLIRPEFGTDNAVIGEADHCAGDEVAHGIGSELKCRSRLGGLRNFYYREAA